MDKQCLKLENCYLNNNSEIKQKKKKTTITSYYFAKYIIFRSRSLSFRKNLDYDK